MPEPTCDYSLRFEIDINKDNSLLGIHPFGKRKSGDGMTMSKKRYSFSHSIKGKAFSIKI